MWSASRPGRFKIALITYWIVGWVDPRTDLGAVKEGKILFVPGIEPRPFSPSLYRLSYPRSYSIRSERNVDNYFFSELLVLCLFFLIHAFPRVSTTRFDKILDFPVAWDECKRIHLTGKWPCIILTLRVAVNWGIPTVRASYDRSPMRSRVRSLMHLLVWSRWQETTINWSVPLTEFIMNYRRYKLHEFSISWSIR
jgi:hypothetical protein